MAIVVGTTTITIAVTLARCTLRPITINKTTLHCLLLSITTFIRISTNTINPITNIPLYSIQTMDFSRRIRNGTLVVINLTTIMPEVTITTPITIQLVLAAGV